MQRANDCEPQYIVNKMIQNDREYNKSHARVAAERIFDGKEGRRSMFRRDITENQRPA